MDAGSGGIESDGAREADAGGQGRGALQQHGDDGLACVGEGQSGQHEKEGDLHCCGVVGCWCACGEERMGEAINARGTIGLRLSSSRPFCFEQCADQLTRDRTGGG